jgi:hypothetical protein
MARYRFHAMNGSDFVFDAVGKDIRAPGRVTRWAESVAQDLMDRLDGETDWSAWYVSVHDLSGRRVLVQPFVPPQGDALPRGASRRSQPAPQMTA